MQKKMGAYVRFSRTHCPISRLAGVSKFRSPELLSVAIAQSATEAPADASYSACRGVAAVPLLEARKTPMESAWE